MSREAFDKLLGQLDGEEREKIYAMAAAYGLDFGDPSWIPFALTQATLVTLREEINEAASAIEEAVDQALHKLDARAKTVEKSTRTVLEAQAHVLARIGQSLRALEASAVEKHKATLAELNGQYLQALIDRSTHDIVSNVTQSLTGDHGVLASSVTENALKLEQSRQRFEHAVEEAIGTIRSTANTAIGSTRRGVRRTLWGTVATACISAMLATGTIWFVSQHQAASDADLLRAYAGQRDELLKQVEGAKQLLAAQRTGSLSLRYYGPDLYLLAPAGFGEPERCGNNGLLGWLQPGGTPCVPLGRTG
jgi:hypothetical protein